MFGEILFFKTTLFFVLKRIEPIFAAIKIIEKYSQT